MSDYRHITQILDERTDKTDYWEKFEDVTTRGWGETAILDTMLNVLEKISDRLDSIEELLKKGDNQ